MSTVIGDALKHAKEVFPDESCGLVIIFKGKERYIPCRNIAKYPENGFKLHPLDYAAAEDLGEVVKVVHSHPYTKPEPSEGDKVILATETLPWIIVNPQTNAYTETFPTKYELPFVGRKFVPGIIDCYSLVRDYYKKELNIEIPDFEREDFWWQDGQDLYRDNFEKAGFHKVDTLQKHDGIIMLLASSVPNHAGVYLGDNKVLHHVQHRLSSIDVYGTWWQKNTWAFVRHEEFM